MKEKMKTRKTTGDISVAVPFISVKNLCMDFNGNKVLNDISFTIPEGEILGIIGRSGAGKSVLMHLLRGIEQPPTSGSVIYHMAACNACDFMDTRSSAGNACPQCGGGHMVPVDVDLWDTQNDGMKSRVMHRTAIMFQRSFALYGDDRVIENVLHALDDINYPSEHAVSRAADLIDQVRLSHRMMHIARDLSGGRSNGLSLHGSLQKTLRCYLPTSRQGRSILKQPMLSMLCLPNRSGKTKWAWSSPRIFHR